MVECTNEPREPQDGALGRALAPEVAVKTFRFAACVGSHGLNGYREDQMRKTRRSILVTLGVALIAAAASAQPPEQPLPTVDEVLARMAKTARELSSYQDEATLYLHTEMFAVVTDVRQPIRTLFVPPKRVKAFRGIITAYSDAKEFTYLIRPLNQYGITPLEKNDFRRILRHFAPNTRLGQIDLNPAAFVMAERPDEALRDAFRNLEVTGRQKMNGQECWVLTAKSRGNGILGRRSEARLLLRCSDGLILQITVDLTDAVRKAAAGAALAIARVHLKVESGEIALDRKVPDDAFRFVPPEGAKPMDVKNLGVPKLNQEEITYSLEGEPAPDFRLMSLKGETVRLSSLKGKIVILDFWAVWQGRCKADLPRMEALYRFFKDRELVVIGVNEDEGFMEVVARFAEVFKLTFPILLDPKRTVGAKYRVTAIPTVVLIDAEGVIRKGYIGYDPKIKEKLLVEIQELLGEK